MKRATSLLLIASMSMLTGCASIVSSNKSTTYIETDPENARCELHAQDFKRVIQTPNSINLPAEASPITIACSAPGYRTTTQNLEASYDGWIIGNVLFGGIIGFAVDAGRGAGKKFPSQYMIVLDPESFASIEARDLYYDTRVESIKNKYNPVIKKATTQCEEKNQRSGTFNANNDCATEIKAVEAQRDKEIEEMEKRRASSKILGVNTDQPAPQTLPADPNQPPPSTQPAPAS